MSIRENFTLYIHQLQDQICAAIENAGGGGKFQEDKWERPGGGGGKTRIIRGDEVFEKGGVNTSVVHGKLPASMQERLGVKHEDFFACGISLVIHPTNPHVPTVHANFRFFELYDDKGAAVDRWFGGGADLTPYYYQQEDVVHFHKSLKAAADPFGAELYPLYKKECDHYFLNTHRNENRGVGGMFFDYLKADDRRDDLFWLDFTKSIGDAFVPAYIPIVERRKHDAFLEKHVEWQQIRRGRYVEFNLIHDRGTLFGLKTNGRIESILMSLPALARWEYDHQPQSGSDEALLLEALKHRDWINDPL